VGMVFPLAHDSLEAVFPFATHEKSWIPAFAGMTSSLNALQPDVPLVVGGDALKPLSLRERGWGEGRGSHRRL
jgi:hypothetical protein